MKNDQIKTFVGSQVFTFKAGLIGGIGAGIVEVLLVSGFGSKPANFSALLFATVAYGILGGIIGKIFNVILQILPIHRDKKRSRRHLGSFITSASFVFVLFLVFFFRAFRDFHQERVRYLEPTGLLTIAVLAIAALILFFLCRWLLSGVLKGALDWCLRPVGFTVFLVAVCGVGIILSRSLSKETVETHSSFSPTKQAELSEKPNVILIMVDTLRRDRLGCYGLPPAARTPNIDALARDATIFKKTYSQATHTKPSTASLFSSRYPSEHRAIHKTQSLPSSVLTIAEVFAQQGYYCGGIVSNINLAPVYNFQQGFHEYTYLPPKFLFGANDAASRLVVYGVLRLVWMKISSSKYVYHFYRCAETITGYFNNFIDRNKDKRFFLFLHFMDPHDPYFEHPYSGKGFARASMPNPDPKFAGPFQDRYRQEIEYLDYWIGRVMEKLKREGLYDNSIIVLTADHGEEFYEHSGWWHGTTLYEETTRIPLIFKKPHEADAGQVGEELTRSIDITPTILSLSGIDVPKIMRGRNLFGPPPTEDYVPDVFSEADHEGNIVHMLRIGPWKYIQTNPDNPRHRPPEQLFNIDDDPHEQNNLVEANPDKARELQLLMQAKYQEILAAAEKGSEGAVDQATQERLRALGYTQ